MPESNTEFRFDLSQLTILTVDDNVHIRRVIRMLLSAYGIRSIFEASDGTTGMELFKSYLPDIVLLDWVMPAVSGIEMVRMLRDKNNSPNPEVPIIMISGYSEKNLVSEARDAGVNEFLIKPLSAKALYLRIANCILSPRTFISNESYHGPDRRRTSGVTYHGEERRKAQPEDEDQSNDKELV